MAREFQYRCGDFGQRTAISVLLYYFTFTLVYRSTYDLLHDYQPTRTLRSSTANKLQCPPLMSPFADRSFSIAAPTVWNSLSPSTRSADTIGTFKSRLKTDLFASAYITWTVQRYRSASDSHATRAL